MYPADNHAAIPRNGAAARIICNIKVYALTPGSVMEAGRDVLNLVTSSVGDYTVKWDAHKGNRAFHAYDRLVRSYEGGTVTQREDNSDVYTFSIPAGAKKTARSSFMVAGYGSPVGGGSSNVPKGCVFPPVHMGLGHPALWSSPSALSLEGQNAGGPNPAVNRNAPSFAGLAALVDCVSADVHSLHLHVVSGGGSGWGEAHDFACITANALPLPVADTEILNVVNEWAKRKGITKPYKSWMLHEKFMRLYKARESLPDLFPESFAVDRQSLLEALRLVSAIAEGWSYLRLDLSPGTLGLHVVSGGLSEDSAETEIPCDYSGEAATLRFELRLALDHHLPMEDDVSLCSTAD